MDIVSVWAHLATSAHQGMSPSPERTRAKSQMDCPQGHWAPVQSGLELGSRESRAVK